MVEGSPPEGVVQLDELEVLVIIDNETDTLSSVDPGVPQVPEVVHAAARMPPTRYFEGHECKEAFDQLCSACHGLSVLITGHRDGQERVLLFDVGPYSDLWLDNAQRLGVNPSKIETVFLSHWHFDHSGGFPEVISAIAEARSAAGLAPPIIDLGAIERVTEYETGLVGHYSFRGDQGAADPLIMDERFIAACVKWRGVTVFSACSHAGIVNACLAARAAFSDMPVDVVLDGYHLAGRAMEARIDPTVGDLAARIDPRVVAPGHCTGWPAKARLADTFARGRYGPSVVGTTYRLSAETR